MAFDRLRRDVEPVSNLRLVVGRQRMCLLDDLDSHACPRSGIIDGTERHDDDSADWNASVESDVQ
jgi:hypothetical protein